MMSTMSQSLLYISQGIEQAPLPEEVHMPSADVVHVRVESFGIGDARTLAEQAYVRPVVRPTRDFVVTFSSITVEAQNALLKLFEDPPDTTVFHVVVPREDLLIPTLRSRFLLVDVAVAAVDRDPMRDFLKMSYGERVDEIAKRTKAKDAVWIEAVVAGAEAYAEHVKGGVKERVLRSVVLVRQYLGARSAGKKMLLEELALSLPQIKGVK